MEKITTGQAKEIALTYLKDYKVIGIFLYGSQNYGLADADSDFDWKAVVLPTFDDFYNHKTISKVIDYPLGQIEVKDAKTFFDTMFKANPAYLETLLTEVWTVDFNYHLWNVVFENGYDLIHADRDRFIKACYGMMLQKRAALTKEYPTTKEEIKEFGYAAKQRHHIIRLFYIINRFVATGEYSIIETYEDTQELLRLKRSHDDNLDFVIEEADRLIAEAKQIVNEYCGEKHDVNTEVYEVIQEEIKQTIRKHLAAELKGEEK